MIKYSLGNMKKGLGLGVSDVQDYLLLYLRLERFDLKSRRIVLFPGFEYLSIWGVFRICSLGSCERL